MFSGYGGDFVASLQNDLSRKAFIASIASTIVAGLGFASILFWYDPGLTENTWADVSCYFSEGWGMGFPFFMAPLLAFMACVREYIVQVQTREFAGWEDTVQG
jgi:hypothetical protein